MSNKLDLYHRTSVDGAVTATYAASFPRHAQAHTVTAATAAPTTRDAAPTSQLER